jgi:phage terminase large subunit GpA-like protein
VSEWATRFRYLSSEYTDKRFQGRYSLLAVPYAQEPMDCANDQAVRVIALMWASQTTKTTCLENVCGYFIQADPSPILLVQPTVEMGQAWSKERLNPTCRDTPVLRELISDQKSRDSGNTIQLKTFPGGSLAIIGANAPAGLAGRPRRVVLLDEVDRYPASAGTEGDPVALAIRRTEGFQDSVVYMTSTPTLKGASRIEAEYEQTDKRHWFVPCGKCGHKQRLYWANVRWPEGRPEEAYYQCEKCNAQWSDKERVEAIRLGEWQPTAPFKGKRGYFLNGIYSPFRAKRGFKSRLHQMAADFLEAKAGGRETLKTWTNTFLAETWDDPSERLDVGEVSGRVEDYGPERLPEECLVATAAVDVQSDRLELTVVAVGVDDESWAVEHRKFFGDPEKNEVWEDLVGALQKVYKREDGVELRITHTAIDMGYKPARVRRFIKSCGLPHVWGVVGSAVEQPTLVMPRQNKHYRMWTYAIATNVAKDIIFARLRIKEPGPRYMHYPKGFGFDDEYFRQLTAEVVRTTLVMGFPKRKYEKTRDRNEALDLRVYGLAALDILPVNWAAVARNLKPGPVEPPKEYALKSEPVIDGAALAPPKPKPAPFVSYPKKGFVNGWK